MEERSQCHTSLRAAHSALHYWGRRFFLRAQPSSTRSRVKLDPARKIGDIDPKLYGNFIEHLGRCIDGGIFDEGSPLSDPQRLPQRRAEGGRKI